MSFFEKVNNGMRPKDAYAEVVLEEFDDKAVPKLNLLSFPVKNVNWSKALTDDPDYFNIVQIFSKTLIVLFVKTRCLFSFQISGFSNFLTIVSL